MKKIFNRILLVFVVFLLTLFIPLFPSVNAASNGKNFAKEGTKPLAVTVSYYNDVDSRGVAWTTMQATDGVLEVVPANSPANADWSKAQVIDAVRKVEDSTYFTYKAYIEDLTEDKYCYRVGSKDGSSYSDVGTFTIDHDQSEINFIYATDSQDYDAEGFGQWNNLVKAAYETMPEAQFFAMGGDTVNNSHDSSSHDLDQWIYALELPKKYFTNSVFMPVSGNHDKLDETFANRFAINYQGSTQKGGYYSFDYGNLHFVGLNTNESSDALNVQLEWLKKDLAATKAQWKIVMMHKGPLSTGDHSNDSDVKSIRELVLPIMAKYKVDMVLQGHDHVYTRTVPYYYGGNYNGSTPNLDETLVTEIVNGKSVTYSIDPQGTFYMTANYAGRKSYAPVEYDKNVIYPATNPYNGLAMSQQIPLQTFTTIKVVDNTLQFNAYTFDGNKATVYDTYNIKKDTHIAVEEQIAALPNVEEADIYDYPAILEAKEVYNNLTDNVISNMNSEMKIKLNKLTTKFTPSVYEDVYNLVVTIDELGEAQATQAFINKITAIKKCYADLTAEQKELVINYEEVAKKENKYKDLLYAQAVTELAYKCANGENVSPFEVYCAYNALTEKQKAYVNLHGVEPMEELITEKPTVTQPDQQTGGCNGSITAVGCMFALLAIMSLIFACSKKKESEV